MLRVGSYFLGYNDQSTQDSDFGAQLGQAGELACSFSVRFSIQSIAFDECPQSLVMVLLWGTECLCLPT